MYILQVQGVLLKRKPSLRIEYLYSYNPNESSSVPVYFICTFNVSVSFPRKTFSFSGNNPEEGVNKNAQIQESTLNKNRIVNGFTYQNFPSNFISNP